MEISGSYTFNAPPDRVWALLMDPATEASGGQPVHIVANHSTLREDLYVVYEGLNRESGHPVIKIIINPLVNWIWIGVLVIVMGTGMALVPNAASVSVPVRNAVAVAKMEEQGMQPAGAGK